MSVFPTAIEYVGVFFDTLERLLGSVDRTEGSVFDKLAGGFASVIRRSDVGALRAFDNNFLDGAENESLDTSCARKGPVRRFLPSKSRGLLTVLRPTLAGGAGTIYAGTEIRVPFKGRVYVFEVTEDRNISASEGIAQLKVIAQTSGADSNVGTVTAGIEFTGLPDPIFDTTFAGYSLTVAGGANAESDAELRVRQRLYERGKKKGTEPSVSYGAMLTPGVKHVVLVKFVDPRLGARGVIYAGDINWQSSETMLNEVAANIESWRNWASAAPVLGMTTSNVTNTIEVTMARSLTFYNTLALQKKITKKIVEYYDQRLDPFAYSLNMLAGRVARADDEVSLVTITSPAASVASPLTREELELSGFPSSLVRYRAPEELISLSILGAS